RPRPGGHLPRVPWSRLGDARPGPARRAPDRAPRLAPPAGDAGGVGATGRHGRRLPRRLRTRARAHAGRAPGGADARPARLALRVVRTQDQPVPVPAVHSRACERTAGEGAANEPHVALGHLESVADVQAPSPFTSQTVGWLNDATAHCRRPTSNCAITRASPIFTTPSP